MRELVVWHVSLSPSKRSVRPMPVICRFISGFVYLMYNASIISNRFPRILNFKILKNLKVEVNSIIKSINRECKKRVLDPLIGEFSPGYLYGTVKNHKLLRTIYPILTSTLRFLRILKWRSIVSLNQSTGSARKGYWTP